MSVVIATRNRAELLDGALRSLRAQLGIADSDVVLFGLALGRADDAGPANACHTTRSPVDANVRFVS